MQGCSVREKATVSQRFFVIYKILEHFPFWTLPECIYSAIFTPVVGCRLYFCNCTKMKLYYICFSENFQNFLTHFETYSWNHHWRSLVGFLAVDYSHALNSNYIKSDFARDNFLKLFCRWSYSHKKVCDEFLFWLQPAIFLRIYLPIDVILQVIVKKIYCSKHVVMIFNFSKKRHYH